MGKKTEKVLFPPPRHKAKKKKRKRAGKLDMKRYTAIETECEECGMLFAKYPEHKRGNICGSNCADTVAEIEAEKIEQKPALEEAA